MAAVAGCLHPVASASVPVQIILTSGTSWTVPANWNNANNKVECGGAGYAGGGGGAYALKNNVALTPGAGVSYQIGHPATSHTTSDSWFSARSVVTAAGATSDGLGGKASDCIGDVKYSGGNFLSGSGTYGGAAGPNGAGKNATAAAGGAGDAGFGGVGGTSASPNGGAGTEWGSAGSGGGGYGNGDGGLYGAGGSPAAPGVIVITWTPA